MAATNRSSSTKLMAFLLAALVASASLVAFRSLRSYNHVESLTTITTEEISSASPPSSSRPFAKRNRTSNNWYSQRNGTRQRPEKTSSKAEYMRDFVPLPPPPNVLAESEPLASQIDFEGIAKNWELPEGSIDLLKQIQLRTLAFDYNATTDILAFRHPPKSGGTSFSNMMSEIFGAERVIPGSAPSGFWKQEWFDKAVQEHADENEEEDDDDEYNHYWDNMAVIYTHTFLRPVVPKQNVLEKLRDKVPTLQKKRFRLMTNVRRPLDWAASHHYNLMCKIGQLGNQVNLKEGQECPPVNLTDMEYKNIDKWTKICQDDPREKRCKKIRKQGGMENAFRKCGSIDVLLDEFDNKVHNMMFRQIMGAFPRPLDFDSNEINLTPTLDDVSLYTLRDLGGLIDYNPVHKEDFIWFAVTERFSESMCLFYYHFRIEPTEEKKSLVKQCRPLELWTEEQKQRYIDNEDFSYTVWRAANAIMDVRMENMRLQIKGRLENGEKLEDMPYVGSGCYDDR